MMNAIFLIASLCVSDGLGGELCEDHRIRMVNGTTLIQCEATSAMMLPLFFEQFPNATIEQWRCE